MNRNSEQPLGAFERRLLDELTEIDARRPATGETMGAGTVARTGRAVGNRARRSRMRPVLIGASLAALVAGGIVLGGQSTSTTPAHRSGTDQAISAAPTTVDVRPAAFTLTKRADGDIFFTIHNVLDFDPAAATKTLNDAGIPGRVINANTSKACPSGIAGYEWGGVSGAGSNLKEASFGTTIGIPPGGGILIAVSARVNTSMGSYVLIGGFIYKHLDQVPNCVPPSPNGGRPHLIP